MAYTGIRRSIALSPLVLAVLLAGIAIRLALLPLTAGADFYAFARLAWLALHGHDVYAIDLRALAPWAYLPLCLHLFVALQWLSLHTGWPFQVLGKLPIVVADTAVAWLLYRAMRRRGHSERLALAGMALYFFNPLVLYSGAFYGRFDSIALACLLLALETYSSRLFAPAYALAISAKTFPLFLLPLLALGRDRQTPRRLALACGLVFLLALPYVVTDAQGMLSHMLYSRRSLGWLSWYWLFQQMRWLSAGQTAALAHAGTLLFPVALLLLVRSPLYVKAAACFSLYIVLNYVVFEQYLLWPLPFLIVVGLHRRSRPALVLVALCTVAGMLENEQTWSAQSYWHYALVPTPWVPLNVALAAAIVAFVVDQVRRERRSMVLPGRWGMVLPRWWSANLPALPGWWSMALSHRLVQTWTRLAHVAPPRASVEDGPAWDEDDGCSQESAGG